MKKSVKEARSGYLTLYAFGKPPKRSEQVAIKLFALNALIDIADRALDGESNDAEHDALYSIRETLAEYSTDPQRRIKA